MKKPIVHILFTLLVLSVVIVACGPKDLCKTYSCYNGGSCSGGVCACPSAYTGPHCEYKVPIDPCAAVVCPTGYVCDSGVCRCPDGYAGVNCEILLRQKFIDSFTVREDGSSSGFVQYGARIVAASGNATDISLLHFNNYFTKPINATVTGDTFIIRLQSVQDKKVIGWGVHHDSSASVPYEYVEIRYQVYDTTTKTFKDYGYDEVHYNGTASEWRK